MRLEEQPLDARLARAVSEIREERIDPAAVEGAANRVWARIAEAAPAVVERIRGCADFQALIPAYRAGSLSEARRLLLEDHTHECVACRKAMAAPGKIIAFPAVFRRPLAWSFRQHPGWRLLPRLRPALQWAVAAALAVTFGLAVWGVLNRLGPASSGSRAMIQSVEGTLYGITGQGIRPVAAGEELTGGAEIRTAMDSTAMVRLRDGSLVEMRERSGFSVSESGKDLTLHLARGSVIVQAARRRAGRLYVATRDCRVAVTGTVFSVLSGVKGSRVSVVEGEVQVTLGSEETVLHRGEQFVTDPSIARVPIEQEIAWSRNREAHLALLREFAALRKTLEQVPLPGLRYASRLLDLLPERTVVYAGLPNLGQPLSEAHQLFRQKLEQSPVLRRWWEEKMAGGKAGPKLETVVGEIRAFSDYLGEEIVMAASLDAAGRLLAPVFLAEVKRPGFKEFVEAELARLRSEGNVPRLRIVENLAGVTAASRHELLLLIRPDVAVFSADAAALSLLAARLESGASKAKALALDGAGQFAGAPFHARLAEAYREGAGLLFSADLGTITESIIAWAGGPRARLHTPPGLTAVKYLIVEQKQSAGRTDTRSTLTFHGPRTGVASWLARPAPLGALDFVSPDATLASGFVVRDPKSMLHELFAWQRSINPSFQKDLDELETRLGFKVQEDLAAALGAEFTVALDGPVLPTPAWKLAVEVYDPQKLQWVVEKLVEEYNRGNAKKNRPPLELTQEVAGGRTYYKLVVPEARPVGEARYVFVDGYLLAAPNRALLDRAIQYRATGYTLVRSAVFQGLLPQDRYADFSGMIYQNAGSTLAPLAEGLNAGRAAGLAAGLQPTLVTFYGEEDRITGATRGSFLGWDLATLGLAELFGTRVSVK